MTNLFDDILVPGSPGGKKQNTPSPEPPILRSSKASEVGCWLIAGSAFVFLFLLIAVGGFFVVGKRIRAQQEVARAERKAREAAEAQKRYFEELEADMLRDQEEVARFDKKREEAWKATELESNRISEAIKISHEERVYHNRLQLIGQGLEAFRTQADSEYVLPNGGDKGSGLSWRVHLLPYMGLKSLYDKFDLTQPWDSPENLPLIAQIPEQYGPSMEGKTRLRTLLNVDGVGGPYLQSRQVVDGLDQTIVVFCFGADKAIEWTKPDDLENAWQSGDLYDVLGWPTYQQAMQNFPETQRFPKPKFNFLFGDLTSQAWPRDRDPALLKAMITTNQGELIGYTKTSSELDVQQLTVTVPADSAMTPDQELKAVRASLEAIAKGLIEFKAAMLRDSTLVSQNQGLSWRVFLLPYIGHDELYRKFKLDEPWNSQHNFPLIAEIPEVFRVGCSQGRTRLCLPAFQPEVESISQPQLATPVGDAPELTTILYYAAPHFSNYWTRPDAIRIDNRRFSESLGWRKGNPVVAATLAGKSIILPRNLHHSKILALRSTHGGEVFDLEKELGEPLEPLR